jgi:hypothetical protein
MTIFGTIGTLLATIPGMTLGTNVFTPENPQVDPSASFPIIKVNRVSANQEYCLDGSSRALNSDRFQCTLVAGSQTGLLVLIGQVQAKLDGNHTSFKASIPLGIGPDGRDSVPEAYWITADWLIIY